MGDTRPYPIQKTNYVLGTEYRYQVPSNVYAVPRTLD
jgi:hypothetical protein